MDIQEIYLYYTRLCRSECVNIQELCVYVSFPKCACCPAIWKFGHYHRLSAICYEWWEITNSFLGDFYWSYKCHIVFFPSQVKKPRNSISAWIVEERGAFWRGMGRPCWSQINYEESLEVLITRSWKISNYQMHLHLLWVRGDGSWTSERRW